MPYVTKQDYFDFAGIDLDLELRGSATDNPSNAVNIFIRRIEDWCLDHLKENYLKDELDWNSKFDAVAFKKGVLHQIDFIRRHGEVSIDYDTSNKVLAPNAYLAFKLGGMCNCNHERTYDSLWL